MVQAYEPINWENYPSVETPLNESNLRRMENGIILNDERVRTHETTKLDKATAYGMVKEFDLDKSTGKITITYLNGATKTIDTNLEKLAINFYYEHTTQRLAITLDDGNIQYVDMSSLISEIEFADSATLAFSITEDGKVTATVKEGSITADMLEPNYLANVTALAEKAALKAAEAEENAQAAREAAELAEQNAATAGWGEFYINGQGRLIYTKTENNLVDFQLTNGRLEVVI